jgi:hypothetical protein
MRARDLATQFDAVTARARSPQVAVADRNRPMLGAITLDALLDRMLAQ